MGFSTIFAYPIKSGHKNGGEGGIRTPGTGYPVRRFSKPLPSATQPPLRVEERAPQPKYISANMRQTCLNIQYFTPELQAEILGHAVSAVNSVAAHPESRI